MEKGPAEYKEFDHDTFAAIDELLRDIVDSGIWESVTDEAMAPADGQMMERAVSWEIPSGEAVLSQTIIGGDGTHVMSYCLNVDKQSGAETEEYLFTVIPEQALFLVFKDGESSEGIILQAYDPSDGEMGTNSFSPTQEDMIVFYSALSELTK